MHSKNGHSRLKHSGENTENGLLPHDIATAVDLAAAVPARPNSLSCRTRPCRKTLTPKTRTTKTTMSRQSPVCRLSLATHSPRMASRRVGTGVPPLFDLEAQQATAPFPHSQSEHRRQGYHQVPCRTLRSRYGPESFNKLHPLLMPEPWTVTFHQPRILQCHPGPVRALACTLSQGNKCRRKTGITRRARAAPVSLRLQLLGLRMGRPLMAMGLHEHQQLGQGFLPQGVCIVPSQYLVRGTDRRAVQTSTTAKECLYEMGDSLLFQRCLLVSRTPIGARAIPRIWSTEYLVEARHKCYGTGSTRLSMICLQPIMDMAACRGRRCHRFRAPEQ